MEKSKASVFYSEIKQKEDSSINTIKNIVVIMIVGLSLGLVIFFSANLISVAVGYIVWAFTENGMLYLVSQFLTSIVLAVLAIFFAQKFVMGWKDSRMLRTIFLVCTSLVYILSYIINLVNMFG